MEILSKRLEKIYKLKKHPLNPRIIKDSKFFKLVESIKEFPEMLEKRPLVVNKDLVVLGGNMRLRAAEEAGLKEIWIDETDWTEEKQKEFIIKDNVGFGEWDWDVLANDWSELPLNDWGLDVWTPDENLELDDFFTEEEAEDKIEKNKIVLEYTQEDYDTLIDILNKESVAKEKIIYDLIVNK